MIHKRKIIKVDVTDFEYTNSSQYKGWIPPEGWQIIQMCTLEQDEFDGSILVLIEKIEQETTNDKKKL